ncbi:MAG TPA: phosphate ABC transporter substrate-binding protein PstS [Candidatus Bathyarchaeia archaeon]|nr:phosphate ABC transporter substrate-binding protein PstS [Candidatus Bathyarchaeia archaeon]
MASLRVLLLGIYAVILLMAGVYGYVATVNSNSANQAASACAIYPRPFSGHLPNCLPSLTISETGSALMYPMFNLWVKNFTQLYPNVDINTENTGSGVGQAFVEKQTVQIGGSTAYFTDLQASQWPDILNIPLAVSAAIINYNLPGFPQDVHLNFSARLLVEIYNGTISSWNDPAIKALNPGAVNLLPSHDIYPMHRSDGSGDTYMFTNYLSYNDSWWRLNVGAGLQVAWPNFLNAQSAIGNPGIVIQCGNFPYSISYVALEALDLSIKKGLGFGYVQNRDGNFVNLSRDNVKTALDALSANTPPDERMSLIMAPGKNAYPIVTYTYAFVWNAQSSPNVAAVVRAFLTYCILKHYGNSPYFLDQYHFLPLPDPIEQLSLQQIAQIGP